MLIEAISIIVRFWLATLALFLHVRWYAITRRCGGHRVHRADSKQITDYRGAGWVQVGCACGRIFFQYDNRK